MLNFRVSVFFSSVLYLFYFSVISLRYIQFKFLCVLEPNTLLPFRCLFMVDFHHWFMCKTNESQTWYTFTLHWLGGMTMNIYYMYLSNANLCERTPEQCRRMYEYTNSISRCKVKVNHILHYWISCWPSVMMFIERFVASFNMNMQKSSGTKRLVGVWHLKWIFTSSHFNETIIECFLLCARYN